MMCVLCGTTQPKSQYCMKCSSNISNYFCAFCGLWSDNVNIFHCKKCSSCKVGKSEDYEHCDKCEACIEKSRKNHNHVSGGIKNNCPICAEYMFNSNKQAILLRCGHALHEECYFANIENSIHCPICFKLVGDDSDIREMINIIIKENKGERIKAKDQKCEVSCFECGNSELADVFELFNECACCGSFNTKLK